MDKRLLGADSALAGTKESFVQTTSTPRSLLSKPPQHQGVFCLNHPFEREHQGVFCSNHPNTKESFVQTTLQNFKGHFSEFTFSTKQPFGQTTVEFTSGTTCLSVGSVERVSRKFCVLSTPAGLKQTTMLGKVRPSSLKKTDIWR